MIIGMIIVYIFLLVLMFLVMISAKVFKSSGPTAKSAYVNDISDADIVAVISAAISKFRSGKKN